MALIPKTKFSSGEISPLVEYLYDSQKVQEGCHKAENCYVLAQGGLRKRQGTKFVFNMSSLTGFDSTTEPRLIPFIKSEEISFCLCFWKHTSGDTRISFFSEGEIVELDSQPGTPYIYNVPGTFDIQNFDYAQSGDVMYIAQSVRAPLKLSRISSNDWEIEEIEFTSSREYPIPDDSDSDGTPDFEDRDSDGVHDFEDIDSDGTLDFTGNDWPQDWSDTNGWPELVGFYEQRLVFASNNARPQTLWFSQSGDFTNFSDSDPLVDSDAITITVDSGQQNKIIWLSTSQRLLIGTIEGEFSISGSSGPITPTSIQARKETNQGGEKVKPIQIGPVTLFLERFGKTVNQFAYDFNVNSYNVVDLSVISPHLTRDTQIKRWAYQMTPHNILWTVTTSGKLLSLTYQREHGVLAWTPNHTSGNYKDAITTPGDTQSRLWVLVERTNSYYIEFMAKEMESDDLDEAKLVDSYLEYSGVATNILTGLEHLEGQEVQILGDNSVVKSQTVSGGSITLPTSVSKATVGLKIVCDVVPVVPEVIGQAVLVSSWKKPVELRVLLYETLLLKYAEEDEGEDSKFKEVAFRSTENSTNTPLPLYTGQKDLILSPNRTTRPRVILRHDQPLPFTLLGMVFKLESSQ